MKNLQLDQHLFLKNLFIGRTNTLLAGDTKLFVGVIFVTTLLVGVFVTATNSSSSLIEG
jgi:hypothetical protein